MTNREDVIEYVPFSVLDKSDPFYASLRRAYPGFDEWMDGKTAADESAYVTRDEVTDGIIAMLYLKDEDGVDADVVPSLRGRRLKIGTFKVDLDHHTSLGKRLLAMALRAFAEGGYDYAYVTMFENSGTRSLEDLLERYGFTPYGRKGGESVLVKRRPAALALGGSPYASFPFVEVSVASDYLLSIRPEYHQRLFGEVQLRSEGGIPVPDETSINAIEKVYLSGGFGVGDLRPGDHLVIYRTSDEQGPAYYRAVVSSICTVTDVRDISSFASEASFLSFIGERSVFTGDELHSFWNSRKYPWVISFLFNFPLGIYPNRKRLLDEGVIEPGRIVCNKISKENFERILEMGEANEGYVID